jgi:hypothetical protein
MGGGPFQSPDGVPFAASTSRRPVVVFPDGAPGGDAAALRRVQRFAAAGFTVVDATEVVQAARSSRTLAPLLGRALFSGRQKQSDAQLHRQLVARYPRWREAVAHVRTPDPDLVDLLRRHRPALVVYEVGLDETRRPGDRLDQAERVLLGVAGLVVTGDEEVADRLRGRGVDPVMVPPMVTLGTWREARTHRPDPLVGFVGPLDERFDTEVLRTVALARPDWRIQLTGPMADRFPASLVAGIPNVSVIPALEPSAVAERNAELDVGVIAVAPGRTDPAVTREVLELLGAGTPVVANRMPSIVEIRPLLRLASTGEEFLDAIEHVVAEDHRHRAEARRRVAESYGPDRRIDAIVRAIRGTLQARETGRAGTAVDA